MTKLEVISAFVGAGVLACVLSAMSFAGPPCVDTDGDTACDPVDNCITIANPGQRDDDLDGYGNICDGDLDQNCIIGGADIGQIAANWLTAPPWLPHPSGVGTTGAFDVNEDNIIGGGDIGQVAANWLGPAGGSGYACAGWCVGTTQVAPPPASCP